MPTKQKRIGIYSGTFDPVHAGHVGFALQAIAAAQLDEVYFLPERRPRNKVGVEHFGHRVAMLRRAVRPHSQLKVLELHDVSFSIDRTLPRLRQQFGADQLVFLTGSDIMPYMQTWPYIDQLLLDAELVIGLRAEDSVAVIEDALAMWPLQPAYTVLESYAAHVSSGKIREALRSRQTAPGLLKSVERYSNRNWLYVSLAN